MKRRDYIKTFLLGSGYPLIRTNFPVAQLFSGKFHGPDAVSFSSEWEQWPDMKWAGPQFWGNRLQDWLVKNGECICDFTGPDRTLHVLTLQNQLTQGQLRTTCQIKLLNPQFRNQEKGCLGMMIGARGLFDDYRSAAVFGQGLETGLDPKGNLVVGEQHFPTGLGRLPDDFVLDIDIKADTSPAIMTVEVRSPVSQEIFFRQENIAVDNARLPGNFALFASAKDQDTQSSQALASFSRYIIKGDKLYTNQQNIYGPICFAQYTLHDHVLKLTAQCAPIEQVQGHSLTLQFRFDTAWQNSKETSVEHPGRAVHFRVEDWAGDKDVPYRIIARIPVGNGIHEYVYEGTIAAEPLNKESIKTAVFSCNAHYGFPDADIPAALNKLEYDICVFLGDQFYENTGGFGPQYTGDFDKTCLDYLRKWMMFGWSYRDIFRHKPCAIIPDDHDVYHGNVWGEGGKIADVSSGYGSKAQDTGGYKMKPEWVNMIQFTQTSHLPDPYDPSPAANSIGVYYTHWRYGGISFAVLEDRKFKSAPANILPADAEVFNGWIMNKEFDIRNHQAGDAELLGQRQEKFLEEWAGDWSKGVHMKAVLSQTNFATVATLPEDAVNDAVVPSLDIPEKGVYVIGDKPTVDMDSNGWPVGKRNKAIEIIRKGFAFHIAGDQHLASFIQYGVDDYEDGSFAFAGPALNNLWPRRFWPPVDSSRHTLENPAYTGNHKDGFGNKFTLHAVANPYVGHVKPAILHNRVNGYGLITFNKKERTITTQCFRRFEDPLGADAQYPGWPVTISQEDNYLKNAQHYLPSLQITSDTMPVLKIFDGQENLVYALTLPQSEYSPRVLKDGRYRIVLLIPESLKVNDLGWHKASKTNGSLLKVSL